MRFILVVLAALWLAPAARAAGAPDAFTPAQRAEIVAILRQALVADPTILRDAVAALQDSEAAHQKAAAQSAITRAGPALTDAAPGAVAGNPHGDVTVVEFYDLRCPYCRHMVPEIAALLHQDANIRLIYQDIPILGPGSVLGARAVLAAARQDGYARLQSAIMQGSAQITEASLHEAAQQTGLDWERLQRDMQDPAIAARIRSNLDLAHQLDIEGTPAFVIGTQMIPGAVELTELQQAVAAARAAPH